MKHASQALKSTLCIAPVMLALASCDKLRDAAKKLQNKTESTAAALEPMPPVSQLDADRFGGFVAQPGRVVVVDFYADWCGPCRTLAPVLERIAQESKGLIVVGKVNVDQQSTLAGQHGVSSIPDVRIYRGGKEVDRFVGAPGEAEVRRRIVAHAKDLPPIVVPAAPTEKAAPTIAPAPKDWLPPGIERR